MHRSAAASGVIAGLLVLLLGPQVDAASTAANLSALRSGATQWNGVNLGSWLVMEQWMVPNIYAMVKGKPYGEGQLMSAAARQGKMSQMRAAVSKHRQTWVTEADFKLMASKGINAVRIPVGYWVMAEHPWQSKPFVEHGYEYLDKAFGWGGNHGIGILLDLHAAPGSQNGYDNSAPADQGLVRWDKATSYQTRSVAVIRAMAARFGRHSAFLGISLLNEPTVAVAPLQAYYKAAYAAVRRYSPHGWVVIAPRVYEQDGSEWQHFMTGSKYTRVLQDLHEYQVSSANARFASLDVHQQIAFAATNQKAAIAKYIANGGLRPVIGEWSLAGPNYNFDGTQGTYINEFYTAQRSAYLQKGSQGWFQWSLKNSPNNDVWSFESAVKYGWI